MAHIIIDARQEGLPSAVTYYKTFPWEPSPLGDITITSTTVMMNSSLNAALDAMLGVVGTGGIVVLVCHAFRHGILLPILSGGRTLTVADNMKIIDKVIVAEAEVATIRKLRISTVKEQKFMLDHWATLLNRLQPGLVVGTFTASEAEAAYASWLEMVATNFEFNGKPRRDAMRELISKLLRVRSLNLSRLELRACNIGQDKTTMEVVRKFFGVDHLTAPTVGTFFHGLFPISTMVQFRVPRRDVRSGNRVAGPLGLPTRIYYNSSRSMNQHNHTTRAFLREMKMVFSSSERGIIEGFSSREYLHWDATGRYAFTLTVDSPKDYHYKASATAVSMRNSVTPDWSEVKKFVQGWIMPNSTYEIGLFPLAGLWTPDISHQPFVLPNETLYKKLIEQVP
jgi:hypothetical protein